MNTTILASLTIPATVFIVLTIMLIKERNYFFYHKSDYENADSGQNKNEKSYRDEHHNHLDFSGGTMGV